MWPFRETSSSRFAGTPRLFNRSPVATSDIDPFGLIKEFLSATSLPLSVRDQIIALRIRQPLNRATGRADRGKPDAPGPPRVRLEAPPWVEGAKRGKSTKRRAFRPFRGRIDVLPVLPMTRQGHTFPIPLTSERLSVGTSEEARKELDPWRALCCRSFQRAAFRKLAQG